MWSAWGARVLVQVGLKSAPPGARHSLFLHKRHVLFFLVFSVNLVESGRVLGKGALKPDSVNPEISAFLRA